MSRAAPLIGFSAVAGGGYLVDCAVKNRGPITTLKAIIADPSNIESILSSAPPAYPSGNPPVSDPGGTGGTGGSGGDTIQQVIAYWHSKIGAPYQWGATGPDSFDCSGLMYAGYKSAGISIPRTTYGMLASSRLMKVSSLAACLPGDIIFPYPGHCFGYIGNGQMIEAPHTGEFVHQASVYKFWTARRVLWGGGGVGGKK